ncbi:MAG: cell wall hydrolase [Chitinophagales bacterium]|nr:cell wall hydrolase [Chitinophagales bacterium]
MRDISLVFLATNERLVIEMFTTSFIRRSLTGAAVFAISILLLASTGCKQSKDTDVSKIKQPTTMGVSTSCTTSTMTSTTTSSTTSSMTTSMTTTVAMMTTTEPMTQKIVSESTAQIEPEPATAWVEPEPVWTSEDDVILLAKLINHEASATYDGKVMVGSCVVNRMNAKGMGVADVIFEAGQFTTAYSLTTYTDADYQVAQQVLTQGSADTRIYFFNGAHPDCKNWFYDINYNYLGAW